MVDRTFILEDIEKKKKQSATLGTLNLIGFGAVGGLAAIGVSSPAGPVILGLSVAVGFVLRQYALVKELTEALISIQIELDRILVLYNIMSTVAEENNISLNTEDLIKWLDKILKYILTIIPNSALSEVASSRSSYGFKISEIRNINVNNSRKASLMSKIGTWFAPQDYVTILMNDFTRVVGSFTILVSEFNMIVLSRDDLKKDWIESSSFNLLLKRSSKDTDSIESKEITKEASTVLKKTIEQFDSYINPMMILQKKEMQKAEEEKEYHTAMLEMLNSEFNAPNTRMTSDRLKPGVGSRHLFGGRKTRKNRVI